MALNSNHTVEEFQETRGSVVEKNCTAERVEFLKGLLEYNGFTVLVVKNLPPKIPAKPEATDTEIQADIEAPLLELFTVGVSDVSFNPVNATYNRELKTKDGQIVTNSYWKQGDRISNEDSWYWKK